MGYVMAELGQVWKSLFGREIKDPGDPAPEAVLRFSMNVSRGARERDPSDEELDEQLQEMVRLLELCDECREKLQAGGRIEDLDYRCSGLARAGMSVRIVKKGE